MKKSKKNREKRQIRKINEINKGTYITINRAKYKSKANIKWNQK